MMEPMFKLHDNENNHNNDNKIPETFPVGYIVDTLSGTSYRLIVYYPAEKNGMNATSDHRFTYPAIIFAHGFMGAGKYTNLLNYTASQGYVVLAFEISTINPLSAIRASEDAIYKSIDYLTLVLPSTSLSGIVNIDEIAVVGHSMGAMTVLAAAGKDNRIKAVVSMAPFHKDW